MRLEKIEIENFRSIRQLELHFKSGFNVIAGINGAGKSTLLKTIEIALSWVKARIKNRTANGTYPDFSSVSRGANWTRIGVSCSDPDGLSWGVVRVAENYRGADRPKSDLARLTEYTDELVARYKESDEQASLPMFVYYSVNRSLIDIPTRVRKKHILDAVSLYGEKIDGGGNLRSFFEWFREREDVEREEREERRTFDYEDVQLHAVRSAISQVMSGYGDLHTHRKSPVGFELRKNGVSFRVEELSDGEKCYLTLVGDIARRLAICNPSSNNPLESVGIIMIDELELHLHPAWQSQAIDKLRTVFPNCQFFITTHSPHVVQNIHLKENDSLTVLSGGNVYNVDAKYGAPVDGVLAEVFGMESLRPKPVNEASKRVWALLESGIYEGSELDRRLSEFIALVGLDDLEISRINMQRAVNKRKHEDATNK